MPNIGFLPFIKDKWPLGLLLLAAAFVAVFMGLAAAILNNVLLIIMVLPVIAAIFVLFNYRVGVVILLLLLPFSQSHLLPRFPGFNVIGYLTLATFVSFVFHQFAQQGKWLKLPTWAWLFYIIPISVAALVGVAHIQEVPNYMVITEAFSATTPARYLKDYYIYPMLTLFIVWMLMHAVRDSKFPERYLWVFAFSALVPAIVVLIVVATSGISLLELSSSSDAASRSFLSLIGFHANEIGSFLAISFGPLLFLASATQTPFKRISLWVIVVLVTLALLLTFSRGAYIAASIALAFFLIRARGSALVKLALVVTIFILVSALGSMLITRISEGWTGAASSSARASAVTASRTDIWQALWPEVERHPVLGNGLKSTVWSSAAQSRVFPTHPHSLYMEILLDMGAVGLTSLIAFYAYFALTLKRVAKCLTTPPLIAAYIEGAYASFLGYLLSSIANGHYTPVPENMLLWVGLSLALGYAARTSVKRFPLNVKSV